MFGDPSEFRPVPKMPHWRPYSPLPSLNPPSHLSTPSQPALHSLPLNSKLFPAFYCLTCMLSFTRASPAREGKSFFFFPLSFSSDDLLIPALVVTLLSWYLHTKNTSVPPNLFSQAFPLMSPSSSFGLIPVVFSGILAINKLLNVQKKHRNCGFMMTNA